MAMALILSIVAMCLIVGGRYLAVSGGFHLLTHRRFPNFYGERRDPIRQEIAWSLLSAVIYGAPAGLLAWGWQERG